MILMMTIRVWPVSHRLWPWSITTVIVDNEDGDDGDDGDDKDDDDNDDDKDVNDKDNVGDNDDDDTDKDDDDNKDEYRSLTCDPGA